MAAPEGESAGEREQSEPEPCAFHRRASCSRRSLGDQRSGASWQAARNSATGGAESAGVPADLAQRRQAQVAVEGGVLMAKGVAAPAPRLGLGDQVESEQAQGG